MVETMKHVDCIPPYWKYLQTKPTALNNCNSSQLRAMFNQVLQYKEIMTTYDPPCDGMSVASMVQREKLAFGIRIKYMSEIYEEIVNEKDFGFEMFWSSIGGFIGIFVGYSLLQLPEILSEVWQMIKTQYDNKIGI